MRRCICHSKRGRITRCRKGVKKTCFTVRSRRRSRRRR